MPATAGELWILDRFAGFVWMRESSTLVLEILNLTTSHPLFNKTSLPRPLKCSTVFWVTLVSYYRNPNPKIGRPKQGTTFKVLGKG